MRKLRLRASVTVQRNPGAGGQAIQSENITLTAVPLAPDAGGKDPNPENRKLFKSTGSQQSFTLQLRLDNPEAFGALDGASEVFIDITPIDNKTGKEVQGERRGGSEDSGRRTDDPRYQPHSGQPGTPGATQGEPAPGTVATGATDPNAEQPVKEATPPAAPPNT